MSSLLEFRIPATCRNLPRAVFLALGLCHPFLSHAQVKIKQDGVMRALVSLDASLATGNTRSSSVSLTLDAARATSVDKWVIKSQGLRSRNNGVTTAKRLSAGTRYDRDISSALFAFVGADGMIDKPGNIASRLSAASGVGAHVIRREGTRFDVFGGVGYTVDRYVRPTFIDGALRERYGQPELTFGEESVHEFDARTTFSQGLTAQPSLRDVGEYRLNFDAALAFAINRTVSATVKFNYRRNSDPGIGTKPYDTLLLVGIAASFE